MYDQNKSHNLIRFFLYNSDIIYWVSTADNCSGVDRYMNSNIIFVSRTDV